LSRPVPNLGSAWTCARVQTATAGGRSLPGRGPLPPCPSDENGRKVMKKNHISTFIFIYFGKNGIRFGKYGFENEIKYADAQK
jgi:hypothetical protein